MNVQSQTTIFADALIATKFYRPALPVDMVHRPRLTTWLKKRQESRPLTLVSAPAGYGKSTLLSCWLDHVDCPVAWLSLDEQDNDLERFLRYFLAAIQTVFPNQLLETGALLTSANQPPVAVIANSLINEINRIETFFILALDDYHLIQNQKIHDLLNELILHAPRNLHLVLSTRMDPPLSLIPLRAKGLVTEIRISSLRFNQDESLRLFRNMLGGPMDEASLAEIDAKAEGWVTGLRLAALAMRHRVGQEVFDLRLTLNNRYVSEYLLSEILAKQSFTWSEWMLKSSIPARFCADLSEALCVPETNSTMVGTPEPEFNGDQFLEWLRASNLFIIPLDDKHQWYRYHHIFREFLHQELVRRFGQEEIRELHRVAGQWYAQKGLFDEAFYHLLPSGDISQAIELVARHRYRMMNESQWGILENWLDLFQDSTIESSPDLWMLKTWLAYQSGRENVLPPLLKHLDDILTEDQNQATVKRLAGEIHALRSLVAYHNSDAKVTISQARTALELIPPELWSVRLIARMFLGRGLLMLGDKRGSLQAFYGAFEEEQVQSKRFNANLLTRISSMYWLLADLRSMQQSAEQALALCQELDHRHLLGLSKYILGSVHYELDDLAAAEDFFGSVVAGPYQNYGRSYVDSVCGLSLTYQAMGKEAAARQVVEDAIAVLLQSGNTTLLPNILALQSEIALKQGNLAAASQWAEKLDPVPPLRPMHQLVEPHLTLVKVWLAQDTVLSRAKAGELLINMQEYLEGTHNTCYLIKTLALQALLADALGEHISAHAALEEALRLAQAGGYIRAFVDAGPGISRLLAQLKVDGSLRDYVLRIRSAFPSSHQSQQALKQGTLLDPLTDRELEILELLQERLSNKEIAARLMISAGTVKGHTIKIYNKLDVDGRRKAVAKASSLGLLISL